jgi:hypothetical protein
LKLDNRTPYPAHLFRGCIDEQRMFGSLAAKITYDIVGDRLRPASDQPWLVSPSPWENEYGKMPHDELFYRGGVDVFVLGSARPPAGRPAPKIDVEVRIGPQFRRRLVVFGDRVWRRAGDKLVPGPPTPTRAVPLTLAHAFGGTDRWDGLDVPFTDNPEGRGFYLEEDRAEGAPLPNIEDPAQLIQRWDDRPEPVGAQICAQGFGPNLRRSVAFEGVNLKELRPTFFNNAFPSMIVPRVAVGDRVSVTGVREDGPIVFFLPASGLQARIGLGEQVYDVEPPIDQIGIEADKMRAFVSYRFPFRYPLVKLQRRWCELDKRR